MDYKKIIAETMFQMLNKKSFDAITVNSILEESQVSRATFYRYYRDKYDLLSWCFLFYINKTMDDFEGDDWLGSMRLTYQFFYDNHQFFENAFKVDGDNSFQKCLRECIFTLYSNKYLEKANKTSLTPKERMTFDYFSAGICHIKEQWIRNGRKESVSDIVQWIFELIPEIFRKYL